MSSVEICSLAFDGKVQEIARYLDSHPADINKTDEVLRQSFRLFFLLLFYLFIFITPSYHFLIVASRIIAQHYIGHALLDIHQLSTYYFNIMQSLAWRTRYLQWLHRNIFVRVTACSFFFLLFLGADQYLVYLGRLDCSTYCSVCKQIWFSAAVNKRRVCVHCR